MVKGRLCQRCGKEYRPNSSTQKYCFECGVISVHEQRTPDRVRVWHVSYRATHLDEEKQQIKQWRKSHPENLKMWRIRSQAKRRALGFDPINDPFVGCEGHHVDKEHIAYIPKELHQSVQHNLWTGQGMEEINRKAYEWIAQYEDCARRPLDIF